MPSHCSAVRAASSAMSVAVSARASSTSTLSGEAQLDVRPVLQRPESSGEGTRVRLRELDAALPERGRLGSDASRVGPRLDRSTSGLGNKARGHPGRDCGCGSSTRRGGRVGETLPETAEDRPGKRASVLPLRRHEVTVSRSTDEASQAGSRSPLLPQRRSPRWPVTTATNSSRSSASRLTSDLAVTDAVRGTSRRRAISPKKSPPTRSRRCRPSRVASRRPSRRCRTGRRSRLPERRLLRHRT